MCHMRLTMVYLSDLKGQELAYRFFLFCIYSGVVFFTSTTKLFKCDKSVSILSIKMTECVNLKPKDRKCNDQKKKRENNTMIHNTLHTNIIIEIHKHTHTHIHTQVFRNGWRILFHLWHQFYYFS